MINEPNLIVLNEDKLNELLRGLVSEELIHNIINEVKICDCKILCAELYLNALDLKVLRSNDHSNYIDYNLSSLISSELYKSGLIEPFETHLLEDDSYRFKSMIAVGKVNVHNNAKDNNRKRKECKILNYE